MRFVTGFGNQALFNSVFKNTPKMCPDVSQGDRCHRLAVRHWLLAQVTEKLGDVLSLNALNLAIPQNFDDMLQMLLTTFTG